MALALYYQGVNMRWIDKYFNNPISEVANAIEMLEFHKEQEKKKQVNNLRQNIPISRNKLFFNSINKGK